MDRALQAGFGDPLGAPLLADLKARGVTMIRADLQGVDTPAKALFLIEEIRTAGLRPFVIIHADQAAWFTSTTVIDIEILNEPDLAGWTPDLYAATVREVADVLDGRHRLWAGSVSNCTKDRLAWLGRVLLKIPLDIGVTVHRYPKNGARPSAPQDGFRSRAAEMQAVRRLMGSRPWGNTEWGYHTGPQHTGWWFWTKRWHWTDEQVAAFAREEWALWQDAGAAFATWYQVADGISADPLDHFGIRRADGSWKPVAETFRV